MARYCCTRQGIFWVILIYGNLLSCYATTLFTNTTLEKRKHHAPDYSHPTVCSLLNGAGGRDDHPRRFNTECNRASSTGLQPVSAWDSPGQLEFRDSQGSGRGGFHRKSSDYTVAQLNPADPHGSAANSSEYRN